VEDRRRLLDCQLGAREPCLEAQQLQKLVQKQCPVEAVADPIHEDADRPAQRAAIRHKIGVVAHPGEDLLDVVAGNIQRRLGVECVARNLGGERLDCIESALKVVDRLLQIRRCRLGENELIGRNAERERRQYRETTPCEPQGTFCCCSHRRLPARDRHNRRHVPLLSPASTNSGHRLGSLSSSSRVSA
jgi:hypothetical protein